jgi:uncharacterized protein (TIGR02145 family)
MKKKNSILLYPLIVSLILLFSCEKDVVVVKIMNPWINYGSMTDQDGNTYKTILIGNQTWMAQNLKTTIFNDGTPIPLAEDASSWARLCSPACCWQNNDPARKVTYGVLYNWYTVNTGKLCPVGWHIPSDAEWTTLTMYLGGENVAGGKLKEAGFRHWLSPNTGATNEAAFSALPGGDRLDNSDALFEKIGEMGGWWTKASNDGRGVGRIITVDNINVVKSYISKKNGMSVRCVWDY